MHVLPVIQVTLLPPLSPLLTVQRDLSYLDYRPTPEL